MNNFLLKADLYKVLSQTFSYPENIAESKARLEEILPTVRDVYPRLAEKLEKLAELSPSLEEYSPFMKGLIPISESNYSLSSASDVVGFYRAFGVEPKSGENPDSLPYQLEFLAFLSLKIAMAPDQEAREITVDAYQKFIKDHLSTWLEPFEKKLRQVTDSPFYLLATEALREFVNMEKESLEVAS